MDEMEKIEESEALPLRYAYGFLAQKGFDNEAIEIRQSKDKFMSYTSSLRRGKILEILEKNNLLEEFTTKYWAFGRTEKGKRKIQNYKRILNLFRGSDRSEDEEEEERIEETSFAYEADLRDYLSNNLSVIEPELRLFKDENGVDGVDYPIDADNRRVDILAIDRNNVPLVIELKVSRGHEKVIGQCLYYGGKVKQILNATKVRIAIVAREISPQLKIAAQDIPDIELFEYRLSVKLAHVD